MRDHAMIFAAPYHDPQGRHNAAFGRQLPTLLATFEKVCLSVTPPTAATNAAMVRFLIEQGCAVVHPAADTSFGEHSRAALRLALQHTRDTQPIVFGFLDRTLFALETAWRPSFLPDLALSPAAEVLVFERSDAAWATHPANYRALEQMVSQQFALLWGTPLELSPGAMRFSPRVASILAASHEAGIAIWGEWLLLAMQQGVPITTCAVDWLAWEDPFWEGVEPGLLRERRESSQEETRKRIRWNVPLMELLIEERFGALRPVITRCGPQSSR